MSACCVFRVLEWSRINPEISFKSFLSLGTLWLSNSSRSSEKDTILNVVRINFEDMCLCLSNSEKQYKCAGDDRQTGGNTDVHQLRRQLFSVRPPQVEIQEVKILLNIPNLPRPPGFLQPVLQHTPSNCPVPSLSCKLTLNTSGLALLSCPDTLFPPAYLSGATALGGKHSVLTIWPEFCWDFRSHSRQFLAVPSENSRPKEIRKLLLSWEMYLCNSPAGYFRQESWKSKLGFLIVDA